MLASLYRLYKSLGLGFALSNAAGQYAGSPDLFRAYVIAMMAASDAETALALVAPSVAQQQQRAA
jgi:hypothetical protein